MKGFNAKLAVIITLVTLLVPLFALPKKEMQKSEESKKKTSSALPASASVLLDEAEGAEDTVRVYKAETKKVVEMKMVDYIYGVVAAECPLSFGDEAIKAQIIAAHTYTRYLMNKNKDSDYDVTTDYTVCQAYIDRDAAMENWGDNAEKYNEKLKSLIDESLEFVITYKNEPIFAAYHAISSGQTEAAENVWGNEVAYLKAVESVGDKLADGYLTEVSLSFKDADSKLSALDITAKELSSATLEKSDSGCVLAVKLGDKSISGGEFYKALGLRSANFDMTASGETLKFTVRGYGHQVGMSQNGANYMANAGETYDKILKHYYSGVEISKLK